LGQTFIPEGAVTYLYVLIAWVSLVLKAGKSYFTHAVSLQDVNKM
jgi:hypothetical protein